MIGTIKIHVNAAHPNMALPPIFSFVDSPSTIKVVDVPQAIGEWRLTSVFIEVNYPDNTRNVVECTKVGSAYVATVPASSAIGQSQLGYTVLANGIDETGLGVEGYALGHGDVVVMDKLGNKDGKKSIYMNLLAEEPDDKEEGDVWPDGQGGYVVWQDGTACPIGVGYGEMESYVAGYVADNVTPALALKADKSELSAYATNTRVDGVAVDLQTLAQDVAGIDDRVDDLEADINQLESDLDGLESNLDGLEELVPAQATTQNQLADKAFVNSSVQTATANFRGNWATWADVPSDASQYPQDYAGSRTPTVNDYMVVQDVVVSGNEGTWRYKYTGTWATDGKNGWTPEYQVNETPMTAAQLAAINSGITSGLVATFSAKQNALSNNQISAIDSVVDERKTYITLYDDDSILEFDWSGEVNQQTMVDADLYDATVDVWKRPIAKIKFGNTVTSIGENTFNMAVTLAEVFMSDSITSIGSNAFGGCTSVEFDKLPNNLTSIGTGAFENCSSITYMSIPSGVRTIGPYAFYGCYQMTHVTIPNNVRTIGQHAFDGCSYLEGITIPETVTSIGPYAFYDCTDLRNVTICSDSLTIGSSAFEACTMLANVMFKG